MELDDILEAQAFDRATIAALAERLRRSQTLEQFIYRETELDEVWRLIDLAVPLCATAEESARLVQLRDAVVEAHDLVGVENRPVAAAARLQEAILAGLAA